MTLGQHQEAFMRDFSKLLIFIHENGYEVRGGELLRTPEMQEIYLKTGKSKTSKSNHLVKCAVDLFIFKDGNWLQSVDDLRMFGDYWCNLNEINQWGGFYQSFKDTPHFERRVQ